MAAAHVGEFPHVVSTGGLVSTLPPMMQTNSANGEATVGLRHASFVSPPVAGKAKRTKISALSAFLTQLRATTGIVPRTASHGDRTNTIASTLPPIGRNASILSQSRPAASVPKGRADRGLPGHGLATMSTGKSVSKELLPDSRPQTRLDDDAEAVLELIDEDLTWSEETIKFRDIAIKTPEILDFHFVTRFFRTLRIVDKDVTHIGHGLLNFEKLEELSLSGNRLTGIDAQNFPQSLRVLHLCANQISDLSPLTTLPQLVHLGVGYNRLASIPPEVSASTWPNILSLDLSFNDLADLVGLVATVRELPKLRSLVVCGNPFTLLPNYRAYMIDALPRILALDDLPAKESEREHFAGASSQKENRMDGVVLHVTIGRMEGHARITDEQTAGELADTLHPVVAPLPSVEFRYVVEYESLEMDDQGKANEQPPHGDRHAQAPALQHGTSESLGLSRLNLRAAPSTVTHVTSVAAAGGQEEHGTAKTSRRNTLLKMWPAADGGIEFDHVDGMPELDLVRLRDFAKRGMVVSLFAEKIVWIMKEKEREKEAVEEGAELEHDPSASSIANRPESRESNKGTDGRRQSAASGKQGGKDRRTSSAQSEKGDKAAAKGKDAKSTTPTQSKKPSPASASTAKGQAGNAKGGKKKGKDDADKDREDAFDRIALPPERIFVGTACVSLADLLVPGSALTTEKKLSITVFPELLQSAAADAEASIPVLCNGCTRVDLAVGVSILPYKARTSNLSVTMAPGH